MSNLPVPEPLDRLPSEILRARLIELRTTDGRRWSQRDIARRMRELGFTTWHPSTVANVETGKREVNVDELVGLAWVLGVSPVALITAQGHSRERLSPNSVMGAHEMWQWMVFRRPEGGAEVGEPVQPDERARLNRVYFAARPFGEAAADETFPGTAALRRQLTALEDEAVAAFWAGVDPRWRGLDSSRELKSRVRTALDAIRREAEAMLAHIDDGGTR